MEGRGKKPNGLRETTVTLNSYKQAYLLTVPGAAFKYQRTKLSSKKYAIVAVK